MPSKHRIIPYKANSFYHIYNRGNDRQTIFRESKDYWAFRKMLRVKLEETPEVILTAFALLPNHFHLQVFQNNDRDIVGFMRSLSTRYALYLRRKYHRTGRVFESSYHAALLSTGADISANRQYILQNPLHDGYSAWKHVGTSL